MTETTCDFCDNEAKYRVRMIGVSHVCEMHQKMLKALIGGFE